MSNDAVLKIKEYVNHDCPLVLEISKLTHPTA